MEEERKLQEEQALLSKDKKGQEAKKVDPPKETKESKTAVVAETAPVE